MENVADAAVELEGLAVGDSSSPMAAVAKAVTPAEVAAKREAKAVEHFTIETKEVDPDDLAIKAGAGSKLGDVENIVFKIARLNAQSDELKQLHRVCFGKPGVNEAVDRTGMVG